MQNRAVCIISGSHCWVRSGQILPDHNLASLVDRRGEQMKAFMFKIVNKQLPEYQSECIFFNIDVVREYNLWGTQLHIFIPRTIRPLEDVSIQGCSFMDRLSAEG